MSSTGRGAVVYDDDDDEFTVATQFSKHNRRLYSNRERLSAEKQQRLRFAKARKRHREQEKQFQANRRRQEAAEKARMEEWDKYIQEKQRADAELERARAEKAAKDELEKTATAKYTDPVFSYEAVKQRIHPLLRDKYPLINSSQQSILWEGVVNRPVATTQAEAAAAVQHALAEATFTSVPHAVQTLANYVRASHGLVDDDIMGYTYPTLTMLHVLCSVVAHFGNKCLSIGSGLAVTEALAERYAADILGHPIQITATEPMGVSYSVYFTRKPDAGLIKPFLKDAVNVVSAFAKYGPDNNVVFLAWPPTGYAADIIADAIRAWAKTKQEAGLPCAVVMVEENSTGGKALTDLFASSWQELMALPSIRYLFAQYTTYIGALRMKDIMSVYVLADDARSKTLGAEAVAMAMESFKIDPAEDLLAVGRTTVRTPEEIAYSNEFGEFMRDSFKF